VLQTLALITFSSIRAPIASHREQPTTNVYFNKAAFSDVGAQHLRNAPDASGVLSPWREQFRSVVAKTGEAGGQTNLKSGSKWLNMFNIVQGRGPPARCSATRRFGQSTTRHNMRMIQFTLRFASEARQRRTAETAKIAENRCSLRVLRVSACSGGSSVVVPVSTARLRLL